MKLHITLLIALLCVPFGLSAKEYSVADGDTINVTFSKTDPSRIAVFENGRLDKLWGSAGLMEVQKDTDKGEVFITPNPHAPTRFSFFVRDSYGSTYTIVASVEDVPAQSIVLKPKMVRHSNDDDDSASGKASAHVEKIKRLMTAMAKGKAPAGYVQERENTEVPLWKETVITLESTYSSYTMLGETYSIVNVSDDDLKFHESEFLDFGDNVLSVSVRPKAVSEGETAMLYVVRSSGKGGE